MEFTVAYDAFASIDRASYNWSVKPYRLSAKDIAIDPSDFIPRNQYAIPLSYPEVQVWPVPPGGGWGGGPGGRGSRGRGRGRGRGRRGRGRGPPGDDEHGPFPAPAGGGEGGGVDDAGGKDPESQAYEPLDDIDPYAGSEPDEGEGEGFVDESIEGLLEGLVPYDLQACSLAGKCVCVRGVGLVWFLCRGCGWEVFLVGIEEHVVRCFVTAPSKSQSYGTAHPSTPTTPLSTPRAHKAEVDAADAFDYSDAVDGSFQGDFGGTPGEAEVAEEEQEHVASDVSEEGPADPGEDDRFWEEFMASEEEPEVSAGPPMAPPPLPPPSEPPTSAASATGARPFGVGKAAHVVFVPGGKLSFYLGKEIVEAVCRCPTHGKCVLTRKTTGSSALGREGQGRPLGLLAAWLAKGSSFATKTEHFDLGNRPSRAERMDARAALRAMGTPDALGVLDSERVKRLGEESEAEDVP
jgi:hypothetical protein